MAQGQVVRDDEVPGPPLVRVNQISVERTWWSKWIPRRKSKYSIYNLRDNKVKIGRNVSTTSRQLEFPVLKPVGPTCRTRPRDGRTRRGWRRGQSRIHLRSGGARPWFLVYNEDE